MTDFNKIKNYQSIIRSSIRIGSRVSGAVGPFLPSEASKDTSDFANKKTIRRRRQHFNGTVAGSVKD